MTGSASALPPVDISGVQSLVFLLQSQVFQPRWREIHPSQTEEEERRLENGRRRFCRAGDHTAEFHPPR